MNSENGTVVIVQNSYLPLSQAGVHSEQRAFGLGLGQALGNR